MSLASKSTMHVGRLSTRNRWIYLPVRKERWVRCCVASLAALSCALLIDRPNPAFGQALSTPPPNPVTRPLGLSTIGPTSGADDTGGAGVSAALQDPTQEGSIQFEVQTPDENARPVPVRFLASLSPDGPTLERDLSWSVYALSDAGVANDDLVLTSLGGSLEDNLPPGSYVVHVAYGMASLSRPLTIGPNGIEERFTLGAGGISLRGATAADDFLPDDLVTFEVYSSQDDLDNGAEPVAMDVDERTVLVLPSGRYTVLSRYGDVNATVTAELDVESGQLTEAVMFHQAAEITLKLVNEPNGEALPNTSWTIFNAGGDPIREFVGAFPTMVLAAGDYSVVARHEGEVFTRNFSSVTGVDREVELVAE